MHVNDWVLQKLRQAWPFRSHDSAALSGKGKRCNFEICDWIAGSIVRLVYPICVCWDWVCHKLELYCLSSVDLIEFCCCSRWDKTEVKVDWDMNPRSFFHIFSFLMYWCSQLQWYSDIYFKFWSAALQQTIFIMLSCKLVCFANLKCQFKIAICVLV